MARKKQLTKEETNALVAKAQAGDVAARNALVEGHYGLIIYAVLKFCPAWLERDDARQIAFLGMLNAIETYDPTKASFSLHAAWRMRGKLSTHGSDWKAARGSAIPHSGMKRSTWIPTKSLQDKLVVGEKRSALEDVVADARIPHADEQLIAHEQLQRGRALVAAAVTSIVDDPAKRSYRDPRKRKRMRKHFEAILALRLGEDTALTMRECGAQLGISAERVRQLEEMIIKRSKALAQAEAVAPDEARR